VSKSLYYETIDTRINQRFNTPQTMKGAGEMLEKYNDILTLQEFASIIRKGRKSSVAILKSSGINYRMLRGSYRISKESVINWIRSGGDGNEC